MLVVGYGTDSSSGLDYWILKNRFVLLHAYLYGVMTTLRPSILHVLKLIYNVTYTVGGEVGAALVI